MCVYTHAHTLRVNLILEESLIKKTASFFSVTSKDYAKGWGGLLCFFDYETWTLLPGPYQLVKNMTHAQTSIISIIALAQTKSCDTFKE